MNELRAAYENSRIFQTSHLVRVPAGCFAVVCESPAHCQITDAVLPHPHRSIVSLHGSRKVAEHIARRLREQAEAEEAYEFNYVAFPRLPQPRLPLLIDDEILF